MISKIAARLFLVTCATHAIAQTPEQQAILDEGNRLFQSEITSWYGSDTFLERCPDKVSRAKGYLSYADSIGNVCVFVSNESPPVILATIRLDETRLPKNASVDTQERALSEKETKLWTIRQAALAEVKSNKDEIFKFYPDTDYNFVPISDALGNRVYILTGPKNQGEVIFGNDYLITFNRRLKLVKVEKIHEGMMRQKSGKDEAGRPIVGGAHTHLASTGNYFTATDVCTLLLYGPSTRWIMHLVTTPAGSFEWRFPTNKVVERK